MSYFTLNPVYTAIDIGTTKICTVIAQCCNNSIEILGVGIAPSEGLSGGIIVDIGKAVMSIKKSLEEAKLMASFESECAYVGISGSHIRSSYSMGMTTVKEGIVQQEDIEAALFSARAIPLQEDEKILHVVPTKYILDGTSEVQNPLHMHTMRLEVVAHIITAHVHSIKDIVHSCSLAGIVAKEVVLEPVASCHAVLNNEEQLLGSLLIDIGGGTSDVALYKDNALMYTEILPIAGTVFTKDLSLCLRVDSKEAERIKKIAGIISDEATPSLLTTTKIDGNTTEDIYTSMAQDILAARGEELAHMIHGIVKKNTPHYQFPAGIVLTGGGALLRGLPLIIEHATKLPTRVGVPCVGSAHAEILSFPHYATAYGLIAYAQKEEQRFEQLFVAQSTMHHIFAKIKNFFKKKEHNTIG